MAKRTDPSFSTPCHRRKNWRVLVLALVTRSSRASGWYMTAPYTRAWAAMIDKRRAGKPA